MTHYEGQGLIANCFVCKKCKSHNWCNLNAIECCTDLPAEEIRVRAELRKGNICGYCNKIIGE